MLAWDAVAVPSAASGRSKRCVCFEVFWQVVLRHRNDVSSVRSPKHVTLDPTLITVISIIAVIPIVVSFLLLLLLFLLLVIPS